MKSLSEIETTSKRAARAAGFSWGISEEVGKINIAYPILFIPFLSRASEVIGKKILFIFDDNQFLLSFNLCVSLNLTKEQYPNLAKKIKINFLDNTDNFSELEWKSLYKLSEETFVEETESLKQSAAGAGLNDND